MDVRFFFGPHFIYKKLFIELFNAANVYFPRIYYTYIYIYTDI